MNRDRLRIWCNATLPPRALEMLRAGIGGHDLICATEAGTNLAAAKPDDAARGAYVVFGQPAVEDVVSSETIRWVQLTSAGYTRYDRPDVRDPASRRGGCDRGEWPDLLPLGGVTEGDQLSGLDTL